MELDDLPTFTVKSVADGRATGSFDNPRWIGENHAACVVGDSGRFIWGRLVQVDLSARTCTFVPNRADDMESLSAGQSYPRLDGYWGQRAELVLDISMTWAERAF